MSEKNKKGAISAEFMIVVIVIIISFAILLIFILNYSWGEEADKETCHESIVMRSTFNTEVADFSKKAVPLKCRTEKICLSMSGDNCEEFGPSTGDDPVVKIKIKNVEDVKEAIANALYDCNSMVGEGKLDFLDRKFDNEKYCLMCARIAFDKEAKGWIDSKDERQEAKEAEEKWLDDIPYIDIYKYMQKKRDNSGRSYLEAVYPGIYTAEMIKDYLNKDANFQEKKGDFKVDDWKFLIKNSGSGYAVLPIVLVKGTWEKWFDSGAVVGIAFVAGAALIATGIGAPIGIALFTIKVGAFAGGLTFVYSSPTSENIQYIPPFIVQYNLDALKNLNCTGFEITPE